MVAKKAKQSLMMRRMFHVAWVAACVALVTLAVVGVSSAVRAMSPEMIADENGALEEEPDLTSIDPADPSGLAEPFGLANAGE